MLPGSSSVRSKHALPINRSRSLTPISTNLFDQLVKFRVDGQTINARNVDALFPGLDRLLLRCLQTGDYRQLDNRLKRNLKPEYLLITGKHIHTSVAAHTEDVLERLIEMGATVDLHFYEPIHLKELQLMCKYGFAINERLAKYHHQTPLSIFIQKNYSIAMLNVLIEHGARYDLPDDHGQTCLHLACQASLTDSAFDFLIQHAPDSCLNLRNHFGGTPLDLLYLSTYEHASLSRMRRLHLLLSRRESKLTRYGMREPNLLAKKQYQLFDILACKEFLFKYRLADLFDCSVRSLSWSIFLFYDVLRACEQRQSHLTEQAIEQRLEQYLVSMIANGEISLEKLVFRPSTRLDHASHSSLSTPVNELDQDVLTNTQSSLLQVKHKLSELRLQTVTLKALCRIHIKKSVRCYPNDIVQLQSLSKIQQAYLTYFNPFVKANVVD